MRSFFTVAACVPAAAIGPAVDYARTLLAAAPQAAGGAEALEFAFTNQMTAN